MLKLTPKQKFSILYSVHRLNLWVGSVRSGKTWASLFKWIRYISEAPKGDLLMIGRTTRSLYRNVIRPMEDFVGDDMEYFPGKGEINIWNRKIFIVSANDERSEGIIRGMTCAGAYGDEITLWPESFYFMLLSRLSIKKSQFFGTTNADSPFHWLKTKVIDRINDLDLRVFTFFIRDNIYLSKEYISNLENEYIGLWRKRYIESKWCLAEGTIYDFFNDEKHVIKKTPKADHYIVGIDYGTGNPSCFILFGVNNKSTPKIWSKAEYYYDSRKEGSQKTDSEYSHDLQCFLGWKESETIKSIGMIKPREIIVDPSASSFIAQLKKDGFRNVKKANNEVIDGIRLQSRMLKNGAYAVGIKCLRTKEDYGGYVWDELAQMRGEDKPKKVNDHTKDAERYVLYTKYGQYHIDYEAMTRR